MSASAVLWPDRSEGVVRTGADGQLYRRSLEDINAEREALASAVAVESSKAGPSTVLSEAETAVPVLPTPASPPRLTDTEVDEMLSGEGRGKRSEIHSAGFPQNEWTPAQAHRWLTEHGGKPIKPMRREGSSDRVLPCHFVATMAPDVAGSLH